MQIKTLLKPESIELMRGYLLSYRGSGRHPGIHFDMERWAYHTFGSQSRFGEPEFLGGKDLIPEDVCGTVACMAGVLVLSVDGKVPAGFNWRFRAIEILGRDGAWKSEVVERALAVLWCVDTWQPRFRQRYFAAKTDRGRATAALAMFDWLLECKAPTI